MTENELSYLAGFFDADGTVYVAKKPGKRSANYRLRIEVGNTNLAILENYKQAFKGNIYLFIKRSPYKDGYNRRPFYRWSLQAHNAMNCLEQLLPFLRVKKRQAQVAIDYQKNRVFYHITPKEVEKQRHQVYLKLKELKKV